MEFNDMPCNLTEEIEICNNSTMQSLTVTHHVLLYTICCFSIPVNLLCFYILSIPEKKTTIRSYLKILAVIDVLFLLCCFFYINLGGHPSVYILISTMATASVYTTVGVSVERFIYLCYPLRALSLSPYNRTLLYKYFFIIILTICINIPRLYISKDIKHAGSLDDILYFHARFGSQFDSNFADAMTEQKLHFLKCYVWTEAIAVYGIPQVVIISLNWCIYRSLKKSEASRRRMIATPRDQISPSKITLGMVAISFACWIPITSFKFAAYIGVIPIHLYCNIGIFFYPTFAFITEATIIIYCSSGTLFRINFVHIVDTLCRLIKRENLHEQNTDCATS